MSKSTLFSFPPFSLFKYFETLFPWCLFENLNLHEDIRSWVGETLLSSKVPEILYYAVPHFFLNSLNLLLTLFANSVAKHLPRSLKPKQDPGTHFCCRQLTAQALPGNCPGLKELPHPGLHPTLGTVCIPCVVTRGGWRGGGMVQRPCHFQHIWTISSPFQSPYLGSVCVLCCHAIAWILHFSC